MNFSISSGALAQHLQVVAKVINPTSVSNIPVLKNILFEIKDGILTLTAADRNVMRISSSLEISDKELEAKFIAPSDVLMDALKELPDQPIEIEVDENQNYQAEIRYSNNGEFKFLAGDSQNFPEPIAVNEDDLLLSIKAGDFLKGLNGTVFAVSADVKRPIMTGILLDFLSEELVYVGTDGRQLMRFQDINVHSSQERQVVLPAKLCQFLMRNVLPKAEEEIVNFYIDQTHILIKIDNFLITASLLEGNYPKYNSVIPINQPFKINIVKDDLLTAVRRVSLFSSKGGKRITLEVEESKIVIKASDLELVVSGEEEVKCEREDNLTSVSISLNSEMLLAMLSKFEGDMISLCLKDHTSPALIKPAEIDPNGRYLLGLLVPLQKLSSY